jgi:hypothetical protein
LQQARQVVISILLGQLEDAVLQCGLEDLVFSRLTRQSLQVDITFGQQ